MFLTLNMKEERGMVGIRICSFPKFHYILNEMKTDPEQLYLPVFLFLMLKMCVSFILFICLFIYIFLLYNIWCI